MVEPVAFGFNEETAASTVISPAARLVTVKSFITALRVDCRVQQLELFLILAPFSGGVFCCSTLFCRR